MSETSRNKELVRSFYESYNRKNLDDSWQTYIAAELRNHVMGGAYDRHAWREMDKGLFPAFADFKLEILDQVAEGDKVATRYTMGGTHTGVFLGLPPSGAVARLNVTSMDRVENGKIVDHWSDLDFSAFLEQLKQRP